MRHHSFFGALLLSTCSVVLTGSAPSIAATIFQDDFETGTVGNFFNSPWVDADAPNPPSSSVNTTVQSDPGSLFGTAGNKYGRFIDHAVSGVAARADRAFGPVSNTFLTVSFDFNEPVLGTNGNDPPGENPFSFNVQVGTNATSGDFRGIDLRLSNGEIYYTLGSAGAVHPINDTPNDYTLGVRHRIDIVANFNSSSTVYHLGTIAKATYDVWIDGVLKNTTDIPFRITNQGNTTQSIDSLRFGTDLNSYQDMYIDNVVLRNVANVVPEPSSVLMTVLGCCGVLALARRRSV